MNEHFRVNVLVPFEAFETRLRVKMYQEEALARSELSRSALFSKTTATEVDLLSTEAQDRDQLNSIETSVRTVLEEQHAEEHWTVRTLLHFQPLLRETIEKESFQRAKNIEDAKQAYGILLGGLAQELRLLQTLDKPENMRLQVLRPHGDPMDRGEPVPSSFSCICATKNYIACGTEGAYIRLFNRLTFEEDFYFPSSALGVRSHDAVTQIAISENETYLAFATSSHEVVVGCLTTEECVVHARHDVHARPITALVFANLQNESLLLSGDDGGQVVQIRVPSTAQLPSKPLNPITLLNAENRIVQFSVCETTLTVSSTTRTYVIHLDKESSPIPVGSQPHRRPAMHGACPQPGGYAFVSRTSGCIWKASTTDGKVLSTLKFSDEVTQLRRPAIVFRVGHSKDHLVMVSDTNVVSLVNISRVALVCSEQLLSMVSACAYGTRLYLLCHKVSSPHVVVVEVDTLQPTLNDIVRSEEIARNKSYATEDTARIKIAKVGFLYLFSFGVHTFLCSLL